jgi:hypothetical protein
MENLTSELKVGLYNLNVPILIELLGMAPKHTGLPVFLHPIDKDLIIKK